MSIKKILLFSLMLALCVAGRAQSMDVIGISIVENDLSARTSPRMDAQGKACALIRICMPAVRKADFPDAIGEISYKPGVFEIYVPEGTQTIDYLQSDTNTSGTISFADFGVKVIGKAVYKVDMAAPSQNRAAGGVLSITSNVDGAFILIDGIPMGETPLHIDNLSMGRHTISVPNTIGYVCADKEIVMKAGERLAVSLELKPQQREPFGIEWATPGGDTAGWYWVRYKKIKNGDKEGMMDYAGNILVPCEYDYVYPDIQNGFFVVTKNGLEGLYEPGNGLVVPCEYSAIWTGSHDYRPAFKARTADRKREGVIGVDGKVVVPFIYTRISGYGKAIVAELDTHDKDITAVYDNDGNLLVKPRFAKQCDFEEGVSIGNRHYGNDNYYFIMDENGKETRLEGVSHIGTFYTMEFKSGMLAVQNAEKKWGYVNTKGDLVIPFKYDSAYEFDGELASVTLKAENGAEIYLTINKKGQVLRRQYGKGSKSIASEICDFSGEEIYQTESQGLIIKRGEKFGFVDSNGKKRLGIEYDEIIFNQNDSIYIATMDGEKHIFDLDFTPLFTLPENIEIGGYKDDIFLIRDMESGTYGYMDSRGNMLSSCIYRMGSTNDTSEASEEMYLVSEQMIADGKAMLVIGDRFGFMDKTGKIIVPVIYSGALPFENGETFVRESNGKWKKIAVR